MFASFTFGMYAEKSTIKVKSQIAKPILEFEKGETLHFNKENQEGKYQFKIKNYNDTEEKTDIEMEYTIEIVIPQNENIEYTLLKEEEIINTNNNKTDKISIGKDTKEEHKYTLNIKYNNTKENTKLNNKRKNIEIKIHSEQK